MALSSGKGMSKGHSFGFPGLHPSLCPFLDLQACSKSALGTVKLPNTALALAVFCPASLAPGKAANIPDLLGQHTTSEASGDCLGSAHISISHIGGS